MLTLIMSAVIVVEAAAIVMFAPAWIRERRRERMRVVTVRILNDLVTSVQEICQCDECQARRQKQGALPS